MYESLPFIGVKYMKEGSVPAGEHSDMHVLKMESEGLLRIEWLNFIRSTTTISKACPF